MKKYVILLLLLIFASCGSEEEKISSLSPEEEHEDHEHQELHLSPEKQKEWGIVVGTATKQNIVSKIALPGTLSLNQNKTAYISSFVEGKVVNISADLGSKVHKGKVLLTINSPEFGQAQAAFLEARAKFLLSSKEYERAKMLFEEKAIEEKEFLRREAEMEKLATQYGALGSALHSYGIDHEQIDELIEKCESMEKEGYMCELANPNLPIYSSVSGTVVFRDVTIGEHVEAKKILFTVSNLNTLWALLDAYEKDLPYINKKSRVTIKSALYAEREFSGNITYISDLIDEKLRTIKIRVEVQNNEGLLKPNMYIQGIIENEAVTEKILAIPEEAVQNMNGKKVVFFQEEKNIFIPQEVKIKEKRDGNALIAEGVKFGQKIVIKGAFYLKAELLKESYGEAHVH